MRNIELNQIKELARRPCDGKGMFFHARLLIVFLIALAAALAGGPRVHAMGADGALLAMVICSEDGTRTIYLKADGTPGSPASDCAECPLCIALSLPALAAPEQSVPTPVGRRHLDARPVEALLRTERNSRPRSRAPPTMIRICANRARAAAIGIGTTADTRDATKVKCVASGMCDGFGRYLEDVRT